MAYNRPPTKSAGNTLTPSEWNTYVKDNFVAGLPDAFTQRGQIAVGSAADELGVSSPSVGSYLQASSAAALGVTWAFFHFGKMRLTAAQNIADRTVTVVAFDAIDFDGGGMSTGANARFTAPAAGYYVVSAAVCLSKGAVTLDNTENMWLMVYKNGAKSGAETSLYGQINNANVPAVYLIVSDLMYLNATDYVDIRVWHNLGSTISLEKDRAWFSVHEI